MYIIIKKIYIENKSKILIFVMGKVILIIIIDNKLQFIFIYIEYKLILLLLKIKCKIIIISIIGSNYLYYNIIRNKYFIDIN